MISSPKNNMLEILEFDGSLKNIPIANKHSYQVKLFHYTNALIQKMRWRAFFYEQKVYNETINKTDNDDAHLNNSKLSKINKLPFPTKRSAPVCTKLIPFESELIDLINKIGFKKSKVNNFQTDLRNKINSIKKSNKLVIFADKTNNLYKISPKNYNNLLTNNITKNYKKCDQNSVELINSRAQEILHKNNITNKRIPKLENSHAYITVKDHKDNFPATIKCRLINTSKTHIAKISKLILSSIVKDVRTATGLIQWKNTGELLKWFSNIKNKNNKRFVSFDIVEFYPSITKTHLINALDYAANYSNFSKTDTEIVFHSCDSLLFSKDDVWKKSDTDGYFDVPMGSFHGAEVCDLVGLYILSRLKSVFNSCGLFRDDGLAVVDLSKPVVYERKRKAIFKLMSEIGFKITLDLGSCQTDFLDVTLNLTNNTFRPYRKPNSLLNFININSDHPYHIKRCLPKMTEKRLSALSSDAKIFNEIKMPYENELKSRGFHCNLKYQCLNNNSKTNKSRNNRVIWYNPPYCSLIDINLGKEFLKLVDKHFPVGHFYRKIFSRKSLKISYSCMSNVKSLIQSHNKSVLTKANNALINNNNNRRSISKSINNDSNTINKNNVNDNIPITSCNNNNNSMLSNVTNNTNSDNNNNTLTTNNYNVNSNINSSNNSYTNSNNDNNISIINKNNIGISSSSNPNLINNRRITRSMTKNINLNLNNQTLINTSNKPTTNNKSAITSKNNYLSKNNSIKTCNCRKSNKPNCPLRGNCLISNVVYKVEVESIGRNRIYIGSTGGPFKDRYAGHKHTFTNIDKKQNTRLSDYVWKYFHRYGKRPKMVWSIIHKIKQSISCAQRICQTCNMERAAIAAEDRELLLNKRHDLSNVCPHNRRFYFK